MRSAAAAVLALAIGLGIAGLSQLSTAYAGAGDALLRLSWRIDAVRVEECRPRTQEELDALAPHMRTPEVCTGGSTGYELRVGLDGTEALVDTLRAGGARGDRPIYVYRDLEIGPGRHALEVTFRPMGPATAVGVGAPPSYAFRDEVQVEEQAVVLIGLDPATGTLVRVVP